MLAALVLFSTSLVAEDRDHPRVDFVVKSVSISGDICYATFKADDGWTYSTTAYAKWCNAMQIGTELYGYVSVAHYPFATPSSVTSIYFEMGQAKNGRTKYTPPFSVSSQSR